MEIGEEQETIVIEPIESPVPAERDIPAPVEPEHTPDPEPVEAPVETPEREPVPA